MLQADIDRLKSLIKKKDFETILVEGRGSDRLALINMAGSHFKKKAAFADASGQVKEKEYTDYSMTLSQVVDFWKENRRELMRKWK